MARPISSLSQTLQDYGNAGSGTGGEKSTWSVWGATLTAGNIVAQSGLASALRTAALAITRGGEASSRLLASSTLSTVAITDPLAQRENKWLVRYHDNVDGAKFRVEIPTADLSLLDAGNEFLNLDDSGPVAAFVTAFQDYVVSPDDPTHAVTVDSIQFVGRRN